MSNEEIRKQAIEELKKKHDELVKKCETEEREQLEETILIANTVADLIYKTSMPVQLILPAKKRNGYELEGRYERTNYPVKNEELLAILKEADFHHSFDHYLSDEEDDDNCEGDEVYTIYAKM